MHNRVYRVFFWYAVAICLALTDQWSKHTIVQHMSDAGLRYISLTSFFKIMPVYNEGVAFSILSSHHGSALHASVIAMTTVLTVCVAIFLFIACVRAYARHVLCSTTLLLSGAIGNGIDRFCAGRVTDFIVLHIGHYSFPAFNMADMYITIGVLLICVMPYMNEPVS